VSWLRALGWLLPVVLAGVFWCFPPRGDDAYYHSVGAVEQVRAWHEGAVFPRHHRGWNGGTGSFAPTVYAPIPMAIQGGLARLAGDGQRAIGLSLALALLTAAVFLRSATASADAALLVATPYVLAVSVTRATTTEAWALAGAALVLGLVLPGEPITVRRGLGLATGIVLVAGSQVGMLVQLGWLTAVAWLIGTLVSWRGRTVPLRRLLGAALRTLAWASSGLLAAAFFWVPLLVDGRHLALGELVEGPFDWHRNFLPGDSELSAFLSLAALCLAAVVLIVLLRGEGGERLPPAIAAAAALALTVVVSAPVWHLPGMDILQFPWRFLGPATVLVITAIPSLSGVWRWLAVALLVVPSAAAPLRLDPTAGGIPVASSPIELARLTHERWGLAPVLPSARGFYAPGYHRLASLEELSGQDPEIVEEERTVWGGSWRVTAVAPGPVLLPLQWWPEWRITVDEHEAPFVNRSGLVALDCAAGTSTVRASLQRSRSRMMGAVLSLGGLVLLPGLAWREGWRFREQDRS
jgi:hypothetical protein